MNIGFIGLGIMGAPMALQLINAGRNLFVNTILDHSALVKALELMAAHEVAKA